MEDQKKLTLELEKLKREAKRLAKSEAIKLSEALKRVSQQKGYEHFHEAREVIKKNTPLRIMCFTLKSLQISTEFSHEESIKKRLEKAPKLKLACVLDSITGEHTFYQEKDVKSLVNDLRKADILISYNGNRFHFLILQKHYSLKGKVPKNGEHIDLCEVIKSKVDFRVSLDAITRLNLNQKRNSTGAKQAQFSLKKLEESCLSDVRQINELWKLHEKGSLKYPTKSPYKHTFTPENNAVNENEIDIDEDFYEDMTEGQMADAMAGFYDSDE